MKYAGFMPNDFVNGQGVCVSFWVQGCPHSCIGCHNPETWDFNGGKEVPCDITYRVIQAICDNGILRNLSILGGEPMCPENLPLTEAVVDNVRMVYPDIKIFLWTGYTLEELKAMENDDVESVLRNIDYLIDGRYEQDKRDITLFLRGSSNQRVLESGVDF